MRFSGIQEVEAPNRGTLQFIGGSKVDSTHKLP